MRLNIRHCRSLLLVALITTSAIAQEHRAHLELRHGLPFVEVMVNGQGPFTFGIDTGTGGQALVSPVLIQRLKLPAVGEVELADPSGKNAIKKQTVKLDSLEVAGVKFNNVEAAEFQASPREGQCDGILGFPLFRDYLLTLDYPASELLIGSGSLQPDGQQTVIPFRMPNDVPLISLQVGSQTIDAHIDSRGHGLSLPEKVAQNLKFVGEPVVLGRGRTVSNVFEIKGAELNGDVHLGSYVFPHPFVDMNPVLPAGNFGAIPLQHFAVTFDQKNKLARLISSEKSITIPPPPGRPSPATPPPAAPAGHLLP